MGMFDTVTCSYPLQDEFLNKELQTKSFDNLLEHYWISTSGELYLVDYYDTFEYKKDPNSLLGISPFPTGKNGKVTPQYYTGESVLYPSRWEGDYKIWPEVRLKFYNGKVFEVDYLTKWS